MARQIISETQEETHKAAETSTTTKSNETVLQADVLKRLFCEWENVERGDLSVDTALADTISKYLKYQEELDPLRKELATRMCQPFVMEKITDYVEYNILIGDSKLRVSLYRHYTNDQPRVLRLDDFKIVAIALNITYAKYFPTSTDTYIDLFSFCSAHGLKFDLDKANKQITIRKDENYV